MLTDKEKQSLQGGVVYLNRHLANLILPCIKPSKVSITIVYAKSFNNV